MTGPDRTDTDGTPRTPPPRPTLFNQAELEVIRKLRGVARGNEQTLDYLASHVATSKKNFDAALDHLRKASESETRTPGFHLRIGDTYLGLGEYDSAETCYARVLELDPDSPYAHLGLSRSYLKRRRGKAALRAARAAVGLKYHFPAAHYFLGIARQQARDLSGAIESFELAIAQNPNFAEAHARLARIYDRHVSNYDLSAEHRRLAQEIRQERRRVRRTKLISELPTLDDALIDEHLPELPDPTRPSSLKPPLGAAPVTSEKTHTASGNGQPFVTVVSGLPRSGTSMMMQMLAAGGLTPLADDTRQADESNPRGYFELAKVKALASDNTWLDQAEGKAIKVVVPLVPYLPQEQSYRLVFMRRNLKEILASQASMLGRLKREGGKLTDSRLRGTLSRQVQQVGRLLRAHKVPVLTVDYTEALERPKETADKVAGFLGMELDRDAMTQTIDPTLYRERAQ